MAKPSLPKLSDAINTMGVLLVLLLIIFLIILGTRWLSSATVHYQTYSPRDGIECLVATSTDGIATSCYSTYGLPANRKVK